MKTLITLFFILSFNTTYALVETNYKKEYQEKIIPLINDLDRAYFIGQNNIPIHYATYLKDQESKKCVVILPGRSEPLEKYAEVIHSLFYERNLSAKFFLMDHRGQGSSGRMINGASESDKGHVDQFENYTLDVKTFLDTIVLKNNCEEKILIAHSLGAGIGVDFILKYPHYFDRAALSSPMLKIQTEPYSYAVARGMVLAAMAAGQGKKFAPGQKGFMGNRNFEKNTFTTSRVRYDMAMDMFDMIPKARLGGVTNRWLNEVMSATKKIRKRYSEVKIPLKVFYAGNETYSYPSEMVKLCDEAKNCDLTFLPTSKHEVLMDQDHNREIVLDEIEGLF